MVAVDAFPIAIGLIVGLALFAACTYALVWEDAHHPVRWTSRPAGAAAIVAAPRRISHTRLAVVCVVFALWSLWATARPVSGWR